MEYRRRRNQRHARYAYRSAQHSRQSSNENGFFSAALLILMAAALVYVFIATPVGAMISKNLFGKSAAGTGSAVTEDQNTDSPGFLQSSAPSGIDKESEFALPPLELYTMQLGVYDSASNAEGLISSLRSLGAAGYSLATDSGVRILASCYTTEAAANSVCTKLAEQGYSAIVYPIKCDGAILSVHADEAQLNAIDNSVELAKKLIDRINDEVIRFDSEERSIEYGVAIVNEMLEHVRTAREALARINDPSGAIKLVEDHFIELTGCFTRFISISSENRVEFSGRLKHLQLEIIERYCALAKQLQSIAIH